MKSAKQHRWLVALSLLFSGAFAHADWSAVNMRRGVTEISQQVYDLHMTIFWVCVAIGVVVFGIMLISMLVHRKSLGVEPATFHDNTTIEIAWTVVPVIILVAMAIPATQTLSEMYTVGDAEIDIEVRGYQWKWQYAYLNDDPTKEVRFMSNMLTPQEEIQNRVDKREHYLLDVDNELVIPTDTRVRFLITSEDVIHSWWVPDFAVKKDAVPGYVHEAWAEVKEPGVYRGQCAELCGKDHGFMPIVVRAVERAEYDQWLSAKQEAAAAVFEIVGKEWTMEELMEEGERVHLRNCAACHQPNGQGIPPAFPSLVGRGLPVGPIQDHMDILYYGRPGTSMQSFASQLNAAELAAVVTYQRNAWGNDQGDMIQPKVVNGQIGEL
jgi:cytochrome c oxidase subunit 2